MSVRNMSVHQFKVFPTPEELRYFNVQIFESRIEYLNYLRAQARKGYYQFVPWQASVEYDESDQFHLGTLSFSRNRYHISAISHESLHAAVWYMKRALVKENPFKDFTVVYSPDARIFEERLCSIQEYILGQIMDTDNRYFQLSRAELIENARGGLSYYNLNNKPETKTTQGEFCLAL